MKKIINPLIAFSILIFSSCGDSKFFSTEKTYVYVEESSGEKTMNNYLNLSEIPELRSRRNVEYSLLDYHGYNLLYDSDHKKDTYQDDEIHLYKGKIVIFHKLFLMDDIYSIINVEGPNKRENIKIFKPISKVSSDEIINPNYLKKLIKENPKFKKNMFLLNFITQDNNESYVFNLYFLNNYLVEMTIGTF